MSRKSKSNGGRHRQQKPIKRARDRKADDRPVGASPRGGKKPSLIRRASHWTLVIGLVAGAGTVAENATGAFAAAKAFVRRQRDGVEVPDFKGMKPAQAMKLAAESGIVLEPMPSTAANSLVHRVENQVPAAGETLLPGGTVRLFLGYSCIDEPMRVDIRQTSTNGDTELVWGSVEPVCIPIPWMNLDRPVEQIRLRMAVRNISSHDVEVPQLVVENQLLGAGRPGNWFAAWGAPTRRLGPLLSGGGTWNRDESDAYTVHPGEEVEVWVTVFPPKEGEDMLEIRLGLGNPSVNYPAPMYFDLCEDLN